MANLAAWALQAKPGDSFVYGVADEHDRPSGRDLRVARDLEAAGIVSLVQRREPDRSISYIAQRTARMEPKAQRQPFTARQMHQTEGRA